MQVGFSYGALSDSLEIQANNQGFTLGKQKEVLEQCDENYTRTVNDLARKKFEQKLLADIRVDLMVCELEGWNKLEYLEELKSLINGLGSNSNGMANNEFDLTRDKPVQVNSMLYGFYKNSS